VRGLPGSVIRPRKPASWLVTCCEECRRRVQAADRDWATCQRCGFLGMGVRNAGLDGQPGPPYAWQCRRCRGQAIRQPRAGRSAR
jgi:hypothetical protein